MPDGLYERDILAWSEHQADLLRRLGRGERVNDVDWVHVAEEIEDVGLSELHSVESFLDLMLVHLLKLHAWPDGEFRAHWPGEILAFQKNPRRRFSPSMRQRIDLARIYSRALQRLPKQIDNQLPLPVPDTCPWTLDELLSESVRPCRDQLDLLLIALRELLRPTPGEVRHPQPPEPVERGGAIREGARF